MKKYLAIAAAVGLLSTAALAQEPPIEEPADQGAGSAFSAFDADGDGSISKSEAQVHPTVSQNFDSADTDQDGTLSEEEFNASFTPDE